MVKLGLDSLELRRIRADLVSACRIIFGLVDVNSEDVFKYAPVHDLRYSYDL